MSDPCTCGGACGCGCCEGTAAVTPVASANRPGLDAIAYRVGTFASFLETMKARLASADLPALAGLRTRETSDPAIALLDAWAVVADVLTFYQERIANEGYLRTATESRSLFELARLVGYRPRPGVAASVYLAYKLQEKQQAAAPASAAAPVSASLDEPETLIPAGARAQSVPGPGELPQSFETSADLVARAAWNALQVRLTRPQLPDRLTVLAGILLRIDGDGTQLTTTVFLDDPGNAAHDTRQLPAVLPFELSFALQPPASPDAVQVTVAGTAVAAGAPFQLKVTVTLRRLAVAIDLDGKGTLAVVDLGPDAATLATAIAPSPSSTGGYLVAVLLSRRADLYLAGTATRLAAGDPLLIATGALPLVTLLRVLDVEPDPAHDRTLAGVAAWFLPSPQAVVQGQLARALPPAAPASPAAPPAGGVPIVAPAGAAAAAADLSAVLASLGKLPRPQPRGDLDLVRDLQQLLAPGADLPLRLLTVTRPEFAGSLYAALANLPVAPAPALAVLALRVKARVFGANAPLELVRGTDGVIVGTREWRLRDDFMTIAQVDGTEGNPVREVHHEITLDETLADDHPLAKSNDGDVFVLRFPTNPEQVQVAISGLTADGMNAPVPVTLTYAFSMHPLAFAVTWAESPAPQGQLPTWSVTIQDGGGGAALTAGLSADSRTATVSRVTEDPRVVWLDAPYPQMLPGSWIVLERPSPLPSASGGSPLVIARAVSVSLRSRAEYGIAAPSTRIELDRDWLDLASDTFAVIRGTAVYAQSEPLPLAEAPIPDPVCGDTIELDGLYDGLNPGRWLIVAGERADLVAVDGQTSVPVPGVPAAEVVMLAGVEQGVARQPGAGGGGGPLPGEQTHTSLRLALPMAYCYRRDTLTVYGNVVAATHGESKAEVLGSGDAGQVLQQFALRATPLTWVAAPTPAGAASTLAVRVNDLLWHEAESLAAMGPVDRSYLTRSDDQGTTTVIFGDGVHGARLPTGSANVRAAYRAGIGKPGNVKAGQISQLVTRPLGVQGVVNPLPASGGADPDGRDQVRRNAPLAVTALDRLVSVQDYADFSLSFAGIGKASAARLPTPAGERVHVTIAGEDDIPILESSDLFQDLALALRRFGDPCQAVELALRARRLLVLSAEVELLPDFDWETVAPAVRGALLDGFGYRRRDLGQPAFLSEVYAAIQAVRGVALADVHVFDALVNSIDPGDLAKQLVELRTRQPRSCVAARLARVDAATGAILPAELVYLSPDVPDTLVLEERQP